VRFLAADHYGGFAVGIVVVITGIRVLRDASLELVDTMPEPELTGEVVRIARTVAGVRGIDKVFARRTGLRYHIDLHVEVDPTLTIAASHARGGHVPCDVKGWRGHSGTRDNESARKSLRTNRQALRGP